MSFQSTVSEGDKIYLADKGPKTCKHNWKRVAVNKVECTICHVGFFDKGDFPGLQK